jgi:(1->4)-alpha-D-glucan 1-alpha-D-glucosylmutase
MSEIQKALKELEDRPRTPIATYRVQMHKEFPFTAAIQILPYINKLGISDFYTSPLLKAGPGSQHGYDIVDHNQLNPELGTEMEYESFVAALEKQRLHHLLDFVPNHMGIYPDTNLWWRDVLENGPSSQFAHYFDIDWHPIKSELHNKVLLPILGDQYGLVLERGELTLEFDQGSLYVRYFDKTIPVNPTEVPAVLRHGIDALQEELKDDAHLREFLSIMTELSHLPSAESPDDKEKIEERRRENQVARERLARLAGESARLRQHIHSAVEAANGKPGDPRSFDTLHQLLEHQFYRLASWNTASHEINYRRFFDVNQLGGVRMELPDVFQATHGLLLRLLAENKIRALRLDHPDGLYDPAGYFNALQEAFLERWIAERLPARALTDADREELRRWRRDGIAQSLQSFQARPLYVAAEKILSSNETMPPAWSLDGSSGYDFLNDLNRLFIDTRHTAELRDFGMAFTGKRAPLDVVIYAGKRLIMTTTMASELNVLAHALNRISEGNRLSRDFTLDSLRDALREVIACFPVYRTYVNAQECTTADRQVIDRAIQRARRRNPAMEPSIFKFVREVLVPHDVAGLSDEERARRVAFSMKFQQYTGPVQAKGLEDTAFYRYNILISINEVGGDPGRFGSSIKEFHEGNLKRRREWPYSMLTTSTHDTKRGEDARARLNVLSEIPERWEKQVLEWTQLTPSAKTSVDSDVMPDGNDEYLYYQALVGAWSPEFSTAAARAGLAERMRAYMSKAIREAKLRTSWIAPNEEYEKAVDRFVQDTLLGETSKRFWPSFENFCKSIAPTGVVNSLSQIILKIISPGIPDFYQGTEFWDVSLVDPDNRRPVDYARRETALKELESVFQAAGSVRQDLLGKLLMEWPDGRVKLYTTVAALRLRQLQPSVFLDGDYLPVYAQGPRADHCVAVARKLGPTWVLSVTPRWVAGLGENGMGLAAWEGATLSLPPVAASFSWKNRLTGETIAARAGGAPLPVGELLRVFPVGIFTNEGGAFSE